MSYTPNVPQPNDIISETQAPILANFQQLNTIFGNDHYSFTEGSTLRGKHKFTTFPDRRGSAPTTLSDEQSFYNSRLEAAAGGAVRVVGKNRDAGSAANQIFPVSPFAMGYISIDNLGNCTISSYKLNIASATNVTATELVVTFQENAPATTPYLVFATIGDAPIVGPFAVRVLSRATSNFVLIGAQTFRQATVHIAVWCFPE